MPYCRCRCCGKPRRAPRSQNSATSSQCHRRLCTTSRPSASPQPMVHRREMSLPSSATDYASSMQALTNVAYAPARVHAPVHPRPPAHWPAARQSPALCSASCTSSTSSLCHSSDPSSASCTSSSPASSPSDDGKEGNPAAVPAHVPLLVRVDPASVPPLPAHLFRAPDHRGRVFHVRMLRTGDDDAPPVVIKWPTCGGCPTRLTELSQSIADLAAQYVHAFMSAVNTCGWRVFVNFPMRLPQCPQFLLVERAVHNFDKFNSNSGWANPSNRTFCRLLQALSHFSFVLTGGDRVLCNLQGGVYKDKKVTILTNPAILSKQAGTFGCSDLGESGMQNFLKWHRCNKFCAQFLQPEGPDRDTVFNAPVAMPPVREEWKFDFTEASYRHSATYYFTRGNVSFSVDVLPGQMPLQLFVTFNIVMATPFSSVTYTLLTSHSPFAVYFFPSDLLLLFYVYSTANTACITK